MFRNVFTSTNSRIILSSTSTSIRSFHASPLAAKTATDKVKEVAEKVNKSVGKGLASAIEKGEEATEATKQAVGELPQLIVVNAEVDIPYQGATTEKAKEDVDVAGQKANQAAAGVRQGSQDFKKDVKKEVRK
ncbi:hypothetical protein BXZ70DRAFT_546326 [Cristinia sonorae]|uniref:Uncharacterized protein n=1 Tax=Cristinia sonorae TaxID=1940300 RepID=A0A8K0UFS4_9AGAR|nr:hypothetical protein BXZ70DRAFT_546326 [Cristinia sonorae]